MVRMRLIVVCTVMFALIVLAVSIIHTNKTTIKVNYYQCQVIKQSCSQFKSCDQAKLYFVNCKMKALDRNKNGIPCETLCTVDLTKGV